ncbi:MAG: nitroreductase family protein [Thermoproteota archaeon]|nr:nitroreductase family protein [Thermoproteota archaeon]
MRYTGLSIANMDAFECIATKLDLREFSSQDISAEIKSKILEAARHTGSGLNTQHWRFVVIEKKENLEKLAQDSTSGGWVSGANFAVIVLTNPRYKFHMIDAGRVVQDMQLAAWNYGVASGLFTGVQDEKLRSDFGLPKDLNPTVIVGFGFSTKQNLGKRKNRMSLDELVYYEKYGNPVRS